MGSSVIRSAQQVIQKINIIDPGADDADDSSILDLDVDVSPACGFGPDLQQKFRERFERYLQGAGHPPRLSDMAPSDDIITDAMRSSPSATDPLFRVKRLMRLATGGIFIPQGDWTLNVSLELSLLNGVNVILGPFYLSPSYHLIPSPRQFNKFTPSRALYSPQLSWFMLTTTYIRLIPMTLALQ